MFAAWASFASARSEERAVEAAEARLSLTRNAIANIGRIVSLEHELPASTALLAYCHEKYRELKSHLASDPSTPHWEVRRDTIIREVEGALESMQHQIGAVMQKMPEIEPNLKSADFIDFKPDQAEFKTERDRSRWKVFCYRRSRLTQDFNVLIHELDAELNMRREALLRTGNRSTPTG